jgi:hypothetical protein
LIVSVGQTRRHQLQLMHFVRSMVTTAMGVPVQFLSWQEICAEHARTE